MIVRMGHDGEEGRWGHGSEDGARILKRGGKVYGVRYQREAGMG